MTQSTDKNTDFANKSRQETLQEPTNRTPELISLFDLAVDPSAPPDNPKTIEFDMTFEDGDDE